jgi:hypothetical protein
MLNNMSDQSSDDNKKDVNNYNDIKEYKMFTNRNKK